MPMLEIPHDAQARMMMLIGPACGDSHASDGDAAKGEDFPSPARLTGEAA